MDGEQRRSFFLRREIVQNILELCLIMGSAVYYVDSLNVWY